MMEFWAAIIHDRLVGIFESGKDSVKLQPSRLATPPSSQINNNPFNPFQIRMFVHNSGNSFCSYLLLGRFVFKNVKAGRNFRDDAICGQGKNLRVAEEKLRHFSPVSNFTPANYSRPQKGLRRR